MVKQMGFCGDSMVHAFSSAVSASTEVLTGNGTF
jgi:hypothetical protein